MTETQQYLYQVRPTRPAMLIEGLTAQEEEIIAQHFAYLQRLARQGIVILVGRTQNRDESTFGITIFKAASEEEARTVMNNDPAVVHGVMRAELFPYRIALFNAENI